MDRWINAIPLQEGVDICSNPSSFTSKTSFIWEFIAYYPCSFARNNFYVILLSVVQLLSHLSFVRGLLQRQQQTCLIMFKPSI